MTFSSNFAHLHLFQDWGWFVHVFSWHDSWTWRKDILVWREREESKQVASQREEPPTPTRPHACQPSLTPWDRSMSPFNLKQYRPQSIATLIPIFLFKTNSDAHDCNSIKGWQLSPPFPLSSHFSWPKPTKLVRCCATETSSGYESYLLLPNNISKRRKRRTPE